MRSKEKIAEEIVLIRYYNVLFYLFFKTGMDDFKRQCLIKKIDDGESMRMKQIQDWCHCHQIPFKTQLLIEKIFLSGLIYGICIHIVGLRLSDSKLDYVA